MVTFITPTAEDGCFNAVEENPRKGNVRAGAGALLLLLVESSVVVRERGSVAVAAVVKLPSDGGGGTAAAALLLLLPVELVVKNRRIFVVVVVVGRIYVWVRKCVTRVARIYLKLSIDGRSNHAQL